MLRSANAFTVFGLGAVVLLAGSSAQMLSAQAQEREVPPVYGGVQTHVRGVFITPVPGVPFSATALIESKVSLPDGTVETKRTINLIARDSRGRIHNERRRLVPEAFHGTPRLDEVHLFDPETRLSTFYEPNSRLARQAVLPEIPKNPALATSKIMATNPSWKEDDLGTTTLNGLTAKGLRRTHIIKAEASGTGKQVEVTDEYWYSEDLHLNLLVHHIDPRTGDQTVAISGIKRDEPASSLFEVPEGFKVVDVTPPASENKVH